MAYIEYDVDSNGGWVGKAGGISDLNWFTELNQSRYNNDIRVFKELLDRGLFIAGGSLRRAYLQGSITSVFPEDKFYLSPKIMENLQEAYWRSGLYEKHSSFPEEVRKTFTKAEISTVCKNFIRDTKTAPDVDFFCTNHRQYESAVRYLKMKEFYCTTTKYALTFMFYVGEKQYRFQIINPDFKVGSIQEILNDFDLVNSQIAYDGEKIYVSNEFEDLNNQGILKINKDGFLSENQQRNFSLSVYRLAKHISMPEYNTISLDELEVLNIAFTKWYCSDRTRRQRGYYQLKNFYISVKTFLSNEQAEKILAPFALLDMTNLHTAWESDKEPDNLLGIYSMEQIYKEWRKYDQLKRQSKQSKLEGKEVTKFRGF